MNQSLTNKEVAFIIFGSVVGSGIIAMPRIVGAIVGTGAWISILISTSMALMAVYVNLRVGYTFKDKSIYEYSEQLVGKFFAKIIITAYIVFFFLMTVYLIELSARLVKISILVKTPMWAIVLFYFALVFYSTKEGIGLIAKVSQIYGIVIIIGVFIIHVLMFTQGEVVNLRPLFYPVPISEYIYAAQKITMSFFGVEILSVISLSDSNKGVIKHGIYMILFIGIIYILIVESCISVMGINDIVNYTDTLLAAVRRINIQFLEIFKRIDGIFLLVLITSSFSTVMLYIYGTSFLLNKSFKRLSFKTWDSIVCAIGFILVLFPKTSYGRFAKLKPFIGYLGMACMFFIPIIFLIIIKVKKYDKKI